MNSDGEMQGSLRPAQRQTGNDSHSLCAHCGEPILPHERRPPIETLSTDGDSVEYHYECSFRMFMGSVGHLRGECSHHGVEDVSEDGMTRRQAAKAAWTYFQEKQTGYQAGNP